MIARVSVSCSSPSGYCSSSNEQRMDEGSCSRIVSSSFASHSVLVGVVVLEAEQEAVEVQLVVVMLMEADLSTQPVPSR